ncbi:MAG: Crp/Fnr family transcriptional regulator [Acidobacteriota bacterium]
MSTAQLQLDGLQTSDRYWHLQQTDLANGLSPADLKAIALLCSDRLYSKEDVIFEPGQAADSLFILNRGCVRLSAMNAEAKEKILGILSSGDIFGEDLLGPTRHFQSQATAHEDSWISIIYRDPFLHLIQERPALALNYIRLLSRKLTETQQDLENQSFLDVLHRLGKTLLKLAESHGRPIFSDRNLVKLRILISHEHLAQLIGGNRPHVSTIMSDFRRKGLIQSQDRKLVINVSRLKRLTGSKFRVQSSK